MITAHTRLVHSPFIRQLLDADDVRVEPDAAILVQQREPGEVAGVGHRPGAGLHPARAPQGGQGRGGEQRGQGDVEHLTSLIRHRDSDSEHLTSLIGHRDSDEWST